MCVESHLQEREEEEKRQRLDNLSREPTLTLQEAELNLQRTISEQNPAPPSPPTTPPQKQQALMSQTDDAKVRHELQVRCRWLKRLSFNCTVALTPSLAFAHLSSYELISRSQPNKSVIRSR